MKWKTVHKKHSLAYISDTNFTYPGLDPTIKLYIIFSYGILKTYIGGTNFKEHIHCCFSVCGTFVFCGAENGLVHVWNTETGI